MCRNGGFRRAAVQESKSMAQMAGVACRRRHDMAYLLGWRKIVRDLWGMRCRMT